MPKFSDASSVMLQVRYVEWVVSSNFPTFRKTEQAGSKWASNVHSLLFTWPINRRCDCAKAQDFIARYSERSLGLMASSSNVTWTAFTVDLLFSLWQSLSVPRHLGQHVNEAKNTSSSVRPTINRRIGQVSSGFRLVRLLINSRC